MMNRIFDIGSPRAVASVPTVGRTAIEMPIAVMMPAIDVPMAARSMVDG
jgi:hypothetical protein